MCFVSQATKRKLDDVAQKVATELQDLEAKRQRLEAAYKKLAKPTNKEKKTLLAEVERVTRREAQLAAELEKSPCAYCRVSLSDARARCCILLHYTLHNNPIHSPPLLQRSAALCCGDAPSDLD
jgi:predicted  nucleic acid-binding Zn-ribbon protein